MQDQCLRPELHFGACSGPMELVGKVSNSSSKLSSLMKQPRHGVSTVGYVVTVSRFPTPTLHLFLAPFFLDHLACLFGEVVDIVWIAFVFQIFKGEGPTCFLVKLLELS